MAYLSLKKTKKQKQIEHSKLPSTLRTSPCGPCAELFGGELTPGCNQSSNVPPTIRLQHQESIKWCVSPITTLKLNKSEPLLSKRTDILSFHYIVMSFLDILFFNSRLVTGWIAPA